MNVFDEYGPDGSRGANRWNQGTQMVGDYGFAMSWQNIVVPGSGLNNISFMFRSGLHYDADQLTITLTACPQFIPVYGMLFARLLLSDPLAGQIFIAFVVSGWDVSSINCVRSEVNAYIGCPTSGIAQRAVREAAAHARGVSKARQL
jgi:hypothetical protein